MTAKLKAIPCNNRLGYLRLISKSFKNLNFKKIKKKNNKLF